MLNALKAVASEQTLNPSQQQRTASQNNNRYAAVPSTVSSAIALGWSIIPVDINKKPYFSWKPYQAERATTEQITQWQKQYNPPAWAVITGSISNLIILDGDGKAGQETFERLGINSHRRTGSGGLHCDFEHPGWYVPTLNSKSKVELGKRWQGLDIRGDGGYAVFCGRNTSGEYVWLRTPGELDSLDTLPTDLRKFLGLFNPPEEKMKRSIADVALEKFLGEASMIGRDNACFKLAKQMHDNNYTQMEAESYCAEFARRTHTTNQKGDHEPFTEADARDKVASAYSYAKREPWGNTSPYSPGQDHSSNGNRHHTSKHRTQPDLETIIQRLDENEYGDGLLFAEVFNGQVCHDHSEKAWYLWNEHHWKKDTTGKIKQMVSGHLGSIYLKARGDVHKQMVDIQAEIEQRQKENKEDEKLPKLNTRLAYLGGLMEALEKRARALRGANRMKNALTFAMSEHNIGITADIWDSDPWLIAVNNGVVDLRTGQLRDGYPIDYIRSVSPTEWTGLNTPCPRFERFLQEIFEVLPEAQLQKLTDGKFHDLPKEEQERITAEHRKKLTDFLQRLFGYSLAGLSTEAIFPLLYGEEGRNGKDTLFKVLKFVLGLAIADAISNDVFLSADRGRAAGAATPHLADLQGKRMVWGSETKQGDRINVSQIKQLTGGGDISARKNYGDQYTFAPTHTLFLMTNYKPHADAKDKAFWTRACLIEFALRFVDKPQGPSERKADTNLAEDLKAEASGILAWLVRGCLDYQKQGLNRPEIVLLSTESYRASEDNIQQFIDDCCVLHEKASIGAQKLYDTYKAWCGSNNLTHINGRLFGEDMSKRFTKERKSGGLAYQKIGIRTDDTPPDDQSGVGSKADNVGSKTHPTHHTEPASEATSHHTEERDSVGYVGLNQEVPYSTPHEDKKSTLYGNTLHTLHTTEDREVTKQPLEPSETSVKGQEAPYINPTHSLETFWSVGKKHNYPEIVDLDLKAGKMGWNGFILTHRLRIPDVVARLGGNQ